MKHLIQKTATREPKWWGSTFSADVVIAYLSGELSYDNIVEWETKYNNGIKPIPELGTKKILDYYLKTGIVPSPRVEEFIQQKDTEKNVIKTASLKISNGLESFIKDAINKSVSSPSDLIHNLATASDTYLYVDSDDYNDIDQQKMKEVNEFWDSIKQMISAVEDGYY